MNQTALVGQGMPRAGVERLESFGYTVLLLPTHPHLSAPVADHPDTLIFRYQSTLITGSFYRELSAELFDRLLSRHPSLSLLCDPTDARSPYPLDVRFNAVTAGGHLFGNLGHLSDLLLSYAEENELCAHHVSQGYAGCSAFALDSLVCSADIGILRAAEAVGLLTLPIRTGGVLLPPFPYGFIGGAVSVTRDAVYTCGTLSTHPDAVRITDAITASGRRTVPLFDGPLLDVGGFLLFDE